MVLVDNNIELESLVKGREGKDDDSCTVSHDKEAGDEDFRGGVSAYARTYW